MTDQRIPVFLLTGFLGSGKTTVLNHWLAQPEFSNTAVIVNEFGAIGVDNELIAKSDDNTIELTTGCLCCTVSGSLVDTLQDLMIRQRRGEIKNFDSVMIETTGLADPAPVIQALMTSPVVGEYRLCRVITTVEAPQGLSTIKDYPEAMKQAAVADDIIVTKMDLSKDHGAATRSSLRTLNPGAAFHEARPDAIPVILSLEDGGSYDVAVRADNVQQWLNVEAFDDHDHHHAHGNAHDSGISSFVLSFDGPMVWQEVAAWLDALVIAHGPQMLRVKGILNIEGRDQPIVVQAVQRLFHPPFALEKWPDDRPQSRLVFITNKISEAYVREVYDVIRAPKGTSIQPNTVNLGA